MINKIFMSGYSSPSSSSTSSSLVLTKYSMIFVSFIILMSFNINSNVLVDANPQYSDLPPPPVKPERFTSKQQLKDYLVKLHEYYAIIGRPRFGRSSPSLPRALTDFDSSSPDMTSSSEQTMDSSNSNTNDDSSILSSLLTPSSQSSLSDTDSDYTSMNAKPRIYIPTKMVINEIDTNNDGLVSVDELRHFLQMFYDSE